MTSALDPELVNEVLDAIRKLADEGMSMIIVSHEMAFVREVADKVVFMDTGQIVEAGTPAEIVRQSENRPVPRLLLQDPAPLNAPT